MGSTVINGGKVFRCLIISTRKEVAFIKKKKRTSICLPTNRLGVDGELLVGRERENRVGGERKHEAYRLMEMIDECKVEGEAAEKKSLGVSLASNCRQDGFWDF